MNASDITTMPATEDDAPTLASIMTASFSASDVVFPLIWPSDAAHTDIALKALTPVQREGRLTFKAMYGDKPVGFAVWDLPKPEGEERKSKGHSRGLPEMPGVNTELWNMKLNALQEAYERNYEKSKDMSLAFLFVHPHFQRQGIGSLLLRWGLEKADELKAKIWLTSTHSAIPAYEKNGWKVVDSCDIDLGNHKGIGIYTRALMLRQPLETV